MELQNHFQLLEEESVGQDAEETPQEDMSKAKAQQNTVNEPTLLQTEEEESSCSREILLCGIETEICQEGPWTLPGSLSPWMKGCMKGLASLITPTDTYLAAPSRYSLDGWGKILINK